MPDKEIRMEAQNTESQSTGPPQADTSQPSGQTPNPSPDTSEKLYAGKYKAPEELEKGYKELESTHGKKISEYDQKLKEADERYNQLITQLTAQQQQTQPVQEDVYETPEEKLMKEVEALKLKDRQRDMESVVNKFLTDNPDLKGDVEQRLALQRFYEINGTKGRYVPLDKILSEVAETTRKDIAALRERVQKEVTETRTELKTAEIPKGTPPHESADTGIDEGPKDYMKWRMEQADRTRRLV